MSAVGKHEAILFFGNSGISREMLYTEFESILDALIPMSDLASSTQYAAYVVINGSLNISSIVFFTLSFDEQGFADSKWNVPLRSLATKGADGPDMGSGKVRIYMQSIDSGNYKAFLWDPSERGGTNDLIHLRNSIRANRLCLSKDNDESEWMGDASMVMQQVQPTAKAKPQPAAAVQLAPTASPPQVAPSTLMADSSDEFSQAIKIIESQRIRITALENALQKSQENLPALQEAFDSAQNEITSLKQQVADFEAKTAELQADLGESSSSAKNLKKQVDELSKKLEKTEKQAKDKIDELKSKSEQSSKSSLEKLEKDLTRKLEDREKALQKDFEAKLAAEQEEQKRKDQQLESFKKELTELRGDKFRLMKGGAEDFFKKVADADISFMAFKPGAGHITIPLEEIGTYMNAPNEFAAKKLNISLEAYETWLEHYNNPVCTAPLPGDKICGDKVIRTEAPAKFQLKFSDRCKKHGGK